MPVTAHTLFVEQVSNTVHREAHVCVGLIEAPVYFTRVNGINKSVSLVMSFTIISVKTIPSPFQTLIRGIVFRLCFSGQAGNHPLLADGGVCGCSGMLPVQHFPVGEISLFVISLPTLLLTFPFFRQ
jgi:hypothetical protein